MKPTTTQIQSLPKWAQEYIRDKERERDLSLRQLNEWSDNQTPSSIFTDDYVSTGENQGPSSKRRYIQGYKLKIEHAGVHLDIMLVRKDDPQRDFGIELQFSAPNMRTGTHVAVIPKSFQTIELVAKENMR